MLVARSHGPWEGAWKRPSCPRDVNPAPKADTPLVQGGGEDGGSRRAGAGQSSTCNPEFSLGASLGKAAIHPKVPLGGLLGFAYGQAPWATPAAGPNAHLQTHHSPHLYQPSTAAQTYSPLEKPTKCMFNYLGRLCESV